MTGAYANPPTPRITSLRLIQPRIDMQNAAHAALTFEQKAFKEAGQKVDTATSLYLVLLGL